MKQIAFPFIVCITFFLGCKCDDPSNPDCNNYNPCLGKTETSAKFKIEESILDWDLNTIWFEADSISDFNSNTRFSSLQDADSFIWHIGAGVYNTKTVILNNFIPDTHIQISLITINKNPNISCFPNDDGRDTFLKNIYVWPETLERIGGAAGYWNMKNPYPIDGYYKGYYHNNPNKETIVALFDSLKQPSPSIPNRRDWLPEGVSRNIPDGYQPCFNSNYFYYGADSQRGILFYKFFGGTVFEKNPPGNDSLIEFKGSAILRKDKKTVDIEVKWNKGQYPEENWVNDKFTGVKIK